MDSNNRGQVPSRAMRDEKQPGYSEVAELLKPSLCNPYLRDLFLSQAGEFSLRDDLLREIHASLPKSSNE